MTAPTVADREHIEAEVASVAAKLTKAQRKTLLAAQETILMDRMKLPGRSKALRTAGLAVLAWRGGDLLTSLGLAVREHIAAAIRAKKGEGE